MNILTRHSSPEKTHTFEGGSSVFSGKVYILKWSIIVVSAFPTFSVESVHSGVPFLAALQYSLEKSAHFLSFSFNFFHFLSLSCIFLHFLSCSFMFLHFHSFSFIFFHFLSFSFIFFQFLSLSCIFFHFSYILYVKKIIFSTVGPLFFLVYFFFFIFVCFFFFFPCFSFFPLFFIFSFSLDFPFVFLKKSVSFFFILFLFFLFSGAQHLWRHSRIPWGKVHILSWHYLLCIGSSSLFPVDRAHSGDDQVVSRTWWAAVGSSPTFVPESPDQCPR